MENEQLGKYASSFGLSLAVTSLVSAGLVILKETNQDTVLAWMKALGHHWVIHGLINLVVFLVLGFAFSLLRGGKGVTMSGGKLTSIVVVCVLLGSLAIAGFFLVGD